MTDLQLRNILIYCLLWVAVAIAGPLGFAISSGAVPGFGDGEALASARGEIAGALALLVTAGGMYLAANRPRVGSEEIAAQVDAERKGGTSRRALTVRRKRSAEKLPDIQVQQLADELEQRLKATPAEGDVTPAPVAPTVALAPRRPRPRPPLTEPT